MNNRILKNLFLCCLLFLMGIVEGSQSNGLITHDFDSNQPCYTAIELILKDTNLDLYRCTYKDEENKIYEQNIYIPEKNFSYEIGVKAYIHVLDSEWSERIEDENTQNKLKYWYIELPPEWLIDRKNIVGPLVSDNASEKDINRLNQEATLNSIPSVPTSENTRNEQSFYKEYRIFVITGLSVAIIAAIIGLYKNRMSISYFLF